MSHPDDIAVDSFAIAMKDKLRQKRDEGYGGWHDPAQCSGQFLSELLRIAVAKGDPLDVGNFAMMLHQRGELISPFHFMDPRESAAFERGYKAAVHVLKATRRPSVEPSSEDQTNG